MDLLSFLTEMFSLICAMRLGKCLVFQDISIATYALHLPFSITIFGAGAKYYAMLEEKGIEPGKF